MSLWGHVTHRHSPALSSIGGIAVLGSHFMLLDTRSDHLLTKGGCSTCSGLTRYVVVKVVRLAKSLYPVLYSGLNRFTLFNDLPHPTKI